MSTLPTTMLEASAMSYARTWIARQREPGGVFHPTAEREYGRVLMKQFASSHPFGMDEIAYFAQHGSKEADHALRELAAERTDAGQPLGAVLAAYVIRILNPLRRRTGPARADNFLRDCAISTLVGDLVERGLKPTRNTASKQPSACSIAAAALTEAHLEISLTAKAVERIWQRYLPTFVGTRFAEIHYPAGLPRCGDGGLFGDRPRS